MGLTRYCKRCGHEWEQRGHPDRKPRECPHCKSPKWDTVRGQAEAHPKPAKADLAAPVAVAG